jgi:PAS domain S-box-containing protein
MASKTIPKARSKAPPTRGKTSNPARSLPIRLDPIITMDIGGTIQSASDAIEEVFGWTPLELFGQNVNVLIPEPRRSELDKYLDRYRHSERAAAHERHRYFDAIHKNGKHLRIELSMSRATLPASVGPYFVGIIRDVTSQIDVSEYDNPTARTEVQRLVTEQTRALAVANLRLLLSDRMAALGTLAAGLGHDMSNVLLPMRARLNALEHAGVPTAAQPHLQAVRDSIAYLQSLSDGLHYLSLDPSRDTGGDDPQATTDLSKWWQQVGSLLRKAVPPHVKLSTNFPPALPPIAIASHWLTQAVLNLIINAGEAIPVSKKTGRIDITAKLADARMMIHLAVKDNGKGMTKAVLRQALDLFYTTKPRALGTGLGLPLARNVVVRASGDIKITSNLKSGTTVLLTLPVAKFPGARIKAQAPNRLLAAVTMHDRHTAMLITQLLTGAGFHVATAFSQVPGLADLWVTEPSVATLAQGSTWHTRKPTRRIVLVGKPEPETTKQWADIGADVVTPTDDFTAMRRAISLAANALTGSTQPTRRRET